MAEDTTAVLVCGYPDVGTAEDDFDALISNVKAKDVGIPGGDPHRP